MTIKKIDPFNVIAAISATALVVVLSDKFIQSQIDLHTKDHQGQALATAFRDSGCTTDFPAQASKHHLAPDAASKITADTDNDTCTATLKNGTTLTWTWSVAEKHQQAALRSVPANSSLSTTITVPSEFLDAHPK